MSGDEPHYLMIDQSLLADRDLDLANNYANDDGRLFGHAGLLNDGHAVIAPAGALQSKHDVGLPLLLLPIYAAAQAISRSVPEPWLARARMNQGLFAYSLLSLCLILLTACAVAMLAAALTTTSPGARWLVLLLGISPAIVSHAFLVFPETLALVVTALVIWLASRGTSIPAESRWFPFALFCLGLLPWLHRKYSLYILGLAFVLIWANRQAVARWSTARQTFCAALFLAPPALFYAWSLYTWGSLSGPQALEVTPFSLRAFMAGLPGLWLDRQSGLLAFAPVYVLLAAAWAFTWKRSWIYLVPFLALYLPMAAYREWWGGFAPAARYLVPILPLAAVPLALALQARRIRAALIVLAVPQLLIDAVIWQHPRWMWPQASQHNLALDALSAPGRLYAALLPQLQPPSQPGLWPLVLFVALIGASILFGRMMREPADAGD